ncbi:MAG: tRNA (adenosine(37)-N6)-threonylcarbamoyltransferase complex ATPase subunit type 1 TsaE [Candidatus Pacebacteria bacterium]|nr:tRNA (adenosine(37)-N6)-threonylcarbamoyltransferase complex ATPase subunit type 1 TsaE [Candidatus Paceibacterota bacterium]
MSKKEIITNNSEETKEFAKMLCQQWLEINKIKNSNWLVCLYGDLGGGKTTFSQGLGEELGVKEIVNSPTFLIMKKYISAIKTNKKYTLYHFDCYRISDYQEILDLGWEDIISGENNIILIEWPERIEKILPKERLNLKFEVVDENMRKIVFDKY